MLFLTTGKQQQELKVQNIKTYTLTFPSISIKSELMVATTVHTAYKTLVWNAEHKKTIFTENNEADPKPKLKVLCSFSSVYLIYKSFEFNNHSTQTRQFNTS